MTTARSWSEHDVQEDLPHAAVVLALLAVLLAAAALLQIHQTCLDRAAGDPVAIEMCQDQR